MDKHYKRQAGKLKVDDKFIYTSIVYTVISTDGYQLVAEAPTKPTLLSFNSIHEKNKLVINEDAQTTYIATKATNPKDRIGVTKAPMSFLSQVVLQEMGLAALEGALKYNKFNWRDAGVRHSVYFDAALRHLMAWFEGQDIDPDSGMHHVIKAMAGLHVLMDSILMGNDVDDRPPSHKDLQAKIDKNNSRTRELRNKYNV